MSMTDAVTTSRLWMKIRSIVIKCHKIKTVHLKTKQNKTLPSIILSFTFSLQYMKNVTPYIYIFIINYPSDVYNAPPTITSTRGENSLKKGCYPGPCKSHVKFSDQLPVVVNGVQEQVYYV